jgi:hypothetical protein
MGTFVEELKHEMSMITNEKILAKHDDLVDALAQLTLVRLLTQTPVAESVSYVDSQTNNPYLF